MFVRLLPAALAVAMLPSSGFAAEDKLFRFESRFWVNLHHFLYVLGRVQNHARDSSRRAVQDAPDDVQGFDTLTAEEQRAWESAVATYAAGPSKRDLVFDRELAAEGGTLARVEDRGEPADVEAAIHDALTAAAPVYRKVWWQRHSEANRARIAELEALLAEHGAAVAHTVTTAYGEKWPAGGFTVQLSAYSNWAGAYSSTGIMIVLASKDPGSAGAQGLESVFHEAMHQWDPSIEARLGKAARLSHPMIFYTAGYAVSQEVAGYVPYAEKNGMWERLGHRKMLDTIWLPYLKGQGTLEETIEELVRAAAAK